MKKIPSPSMIVALLALVLAMGGTGYAAFKLPKNSVTSAAVKNGSLSDKDLSRKARAKLKGAKGAKGETGSQGPQGPAGANGANGTNGKDGADGKDATAAPVAAWAAVSTAAFNDPEWSTNPNNNGVQFYVDRGVLRLRGEINCSGSCPATLTSAPGLPAAMRPKSNLRIPFYLKDANSANFRIVPGQLTSGGVIVLDGSPTITNSATVYFDSISYRVDQ